MKFTQIALSADVNDPALYALGEDGRVYGLSARRELIPDSFGLNEYGGKEQNYRYVRFWEVLDYPIGDPAFRTPQEAAK